MDAERIDPVERVRRALARGDDADDAERAEILDGIHTELESALEVDEAPPSRR